MREILYQYEFLGKLIWRLTTRPIAARHPSGPPLKTHRRPARRAALAGLVATDDALGIAVR